MQKCQEVYRYLLRPWTSAVETIPTVSSMVLRQRPEGEASSQKWGAGYGTAGGTTRSVSYPTGEPNPDIPCFVFQPVKNQNTRPKQKERPRPRLNDTDPRQQ